MSPETQKFKWRALWLSIGWLLVAAIVYLSLTPTPIELPGDSGDKYGHVAAYGVLMFWFTQIYSASPRRMAVAISLALLGIGLEFVQGYTGYRTFDRADMVADVIGIVLGWLVGPPRTMNVLTWIEALL